MGFNTGPLHSVHQGNHAARAVACVFRAVKMALALITMIIYVRPQKHFPNWNKAARTHWHVQNGAYPTHHRADVCCLFWLLDKETCDKQTWHLKQLTSEAWASSRSKPSNNKGWEDHWAFRKDPMKSSVTLATPKTNFTLFICIFRCCFFAKFHD